jgi:hypothetical protein
MMLDNSTHLMKKSIRLAYWFCRVDFGWILSFKAVRK